MEINKIYNENHLVTMGNMPDEFIDLTVTSPPYDKLRDYEGYDFDFEKCANELWRVTKKGGVVVWVVGDETINGSETGTSFKQAIYFMSCGFRLHDTMIYQKRNFSHPERNRYHSVFEYMFVFSKDKPKTFNPIFDRKNLTAGEIGNKGVNTFTLRNGEKSERKKNLTKDFGMRHNVWLGNTRGQEDMCIKLQQPGMMPRWIARDHIKSWSNRGDLVYDPCGGSGTTVQEAEKLGRKWIMSEISDKYTQKTIQVTNQELALF